MLRAVSTAMAMVGIAVLACRPSAGVDPNDPTITAIIDSLAREAVDGAAKADADRALKAAAGGGEVTFITGDMLLTGLEPIRERFRATYAGLQRQQQTFTQKRVRVLSPDVAIAYAVGEGTYTDKAGTTSEPVGMGITLVFVKEHGQWRIRHIHQSIAP